MKLIKFPQIPSTQDFALGLVHNKEVKEHMLIMADIQTAGRGRLHNRSWISEKGSFAGTFIFDMRYFPDCDFDNNTGYYIAQSIVRFLTATTGAPFFHKYPNDIYFAGKKLGGVLVEFLLPYMLIGIGLNVSISPLNTSTSLVAVTKTMNIGQWNDLHVRLYDVLKSVLSAPKCQGLRGCSSMQQEATRTRESYLELL